jgi:putative transposase
LNRGNARQEIFHDEADYEAFEWILAEGLQRYDVQLFSYQLMPNHWHLVLRPNQAGVMSMFMRWITATHTMRYHSRHHSTGQGHVYQGRFKSFPIQEGVHFLSVCRYVERNALRAKLVRWAEEWRWGSLWKWSQPKAPTTSALLSPWPIPRSPNWLARVNEPLSEQDLAAIRNAAQRGCPFGESSWVESTTRRLNMESTIRPRGRPRVRFPDNKKS